MQISKLDKVLFPDDGITMADLADHDKAIAHAMLLWRRDRPVARSPAWQPERSVPERPESRRHHWRGAAPVWCA